ncbi:hypothetical protein INT45_007839 [Circinella minor]|uniref:Uncharacterized protein n=1 Tax=Circinella minor TaxID=1195481 RepID=A0A8H7RXY6_9FUNG|nr:hypothetical protein INT45_007839 [Circinella minor]
MGQAGIIIHSYFYKTTVFLLLSFLFLLFSFTSSLKCNAVEDSSSSFIITTTSTPIHILPRDPITTLADPVSTTATPTGENEDTHDENEESDNSPTPTTTLLTVKPSPSPPPRHDSTTNSSNPSYTVTLNCGYDSFCEKIHIAAIDAVKELVHVLDIENNNISVSVNYTSFCDRSCSNDTFAWGAPSRQLQIPSGDGIDSDYSYPQILAKQFFKIWGDWVDHDIDVEINHDVYMNAVDYDAAEELGWNGTGVPPGGKYWFKDEGPIRDDQVDMTYIILHELLHGVGIISSWGAYFGESSPLRALIGEGFEDEELRFVTPSPYSTILYGAGPVFVTNFQRNTLFDKYLNVQYMSLNETNSINMQDFSVQLLNFCVQDNDAFIMRFVYRFLKTSMSTLSAQVYNAFSIPNTMTFNFRLTSTNTSLFNTNQYLNITYQNMTLLTGDSVVKGYAEQAGRINNRPGLRISHLSDDYADTPDFIMTRNYKTGATLQQLVDIGYNNTPVINYTEETTNGTLITHTYRSPIGPGILRILDSMGYSTVLKRTNYTRMDSDSNDQVESENKDKSCDLDRNYPKRKRSDAIQLLSLSRISHWILLLLVSSLVL